MTKYSISPFYIFLYNFLPNKLLSEAFIYWCSLKQYQHWQDHDTLGSLVLPKFCKIVWRTRLLGECTSFSCLYIEIVYLNFTFCGAYTLSFLAGHTISAKRAHPWVRYCVDCTRLKTLLLSIRWIHYFPIVPMVVVLN